MSFETIHDIKTRLDNLEVAFEHLCDALRVKGIIGSN